MLRIKHFRPASARSSRALRVTGDRLRCGATRRAGLASPRSQRVRPTRRGRARRRECRRGAVNVSVPSRWRRCHEISGSDRTSPTSTRADRQLCGARDEAIARLAAVLNGPYLLTAARLRTDPTFARIRRDQALRTPRPGNSLGVPARAVGWGGRAPAVRFGVAHVRAACHATCRVIGRESAVSPHTDRRCRLRPS